jgi:hypothetical protein
MQKKKKAPAASAMGSQEELDVARRTLERWRFAKMFSGDPVPFSSPGVVLKCRELESVAPGEHRFQIVGMLGAKHDAGAVAQTLLRHPRPANDPVFAMLAPIPLKSQLIVMQELEPLVERG